MINRDLTSANILIVDDHKSNTDVLEDFLLLQGYSNLLSTNDSREVLELYVSFKPDIILLDLTMPHLSGFQVMEKLKTVADSNTYLPILVLTADATKESKEKALSIGASDFLVKPFHLEEVGLRIKNLLFSAHLQQELTQHNKELEEKVKERTQELEITNIAMKISKEKAESSDLLKTAFLSMISHELRTPLNGILGFACLLAEKDLSAEDKQHFSNHLLASSERLISTVENFMDMAMVLSGNLEVNSTPVNIFKLLRQIKTTFEDACSHKKLDFKLQMPMHATQLIIHTDEVLLNKIMVHLLDNAIKFTYAGKVSFGFILQTKGIEFFVKDTGIGINQEAQEMVFESFTQENLFSTRATDGTGLGLAITKGILKQLGGHIKLTSAKGEGTTVYVYLPIPNKK
jgi:signal transduction histidine kinase